MNKNIELTLDFLGSLKIDNLNILDFIDESDINSELTFDELTDILNNNNALDVEIIYYSNAIKYLAENDPSLKDSLEIASEYGYLPRDLNSAALASLLASDILRDEWYNKEDEITEFLKNLEW